MINMGTQETELPCHAEQAQNADDHATVASHDTQRSHRSYDSRRSRGYPTEATRRRRDDDSYYSARSESKDPATGTRRHGWEPHRSRGRSSSQHRYSDGMNHNRHDTHRQSTDRDDGGRDHMRYDRSRSYAPSSERVFHNDATGNGDFRRGRSASVTSSRSEPPFPNRRHYFSGSKSRSPGRLMPRPPPLLPAEWIEWPPCFDVEGSSFVFHPASGMFYEEKSEFFYDPKTKLYYGVKKAAYFRYDESKDPPFTETQRADPSQGTPLNPVEPPITLPPVASGGSQFEKPRIAIHLKTKKIKKPKVPSNTLTPISSATIPVVTKTQKEQVANIEKWQEKQAELKAFPVPLSGVTASMAVEEIKRTIKGEPICVVCKRKFPSIEKLRLHETMSELHKANLAKATQLQAENIAAVSTVAESQQYHDRAEKRRRLHGPEAATTATPIGDVHASSIALATSPDGIGENNIGNKLLQKMGWQTGSSLGKKSEDEASEKSSVDEIRKDWDRIEAMASASSTTRSGQ